MLSSPAQSLMISATAAEGFLELRRPVTVPREIALGRMNDDRTDLEVFQQCRDLVFPRGRHVI